MNFPEPPGLPCPCFYCPIIIAYANVGPFGTYSFDIARGATLRHIVGRAWVIDCPCGRRTKFTAIGADKNGKPRVA